MTNRELKKLDKSELLEMLIELTDENKSLREANSSLRAELDSMTKQLESRNLLMQETGSIAEASLKLNGVFEAAQAAADEYLATIRAMSEKQDEDYKQVLKEAKTQAEDIVREAEKTRLLKIAEADDYWNKTATRYEQFYEQFHNGYEHFAKSMKEKNCE